MFYNNYKDLFLEENRVPFEDQLVKLTGLKTNKYKNPPKYKNIYNSHNINEIIDFKTKKQLTENFKIKSKNKFTLKSMKEPYDNNLQTIKLNNKLTYINENILKNKKKEKVKPKGIKKIYFSSNSNTEFDKINTLISNKKNKITYNFLENSKNLNNSKVRTLRNSSKNIKDIFNSMEIYNANNSIKSSFLKKTKSKFNFKKLIPKNLKIKASRNIISKIIPNHLFDKFMLKQNTNPKEFKIALDKRIIDKNNIEEKKIRLQKYFN